MESFLSEKFVTQTGVNPVILNQLIRGERCPLVTVAQQPLGNRKVSLEDVKGVDKTYVQLGCFTHSASLHSISSVQTGCSFKYTLVGILLKRL